MGQKKYESFSSFVFLSGKFKFLLGFILPSSLSVLMAKKKKFVGTNIRCTKVLDQGRLWVVKSLK